MVARRKALIVVAAFVLMAIGLPWGGNVPAAFAQIQVTSANPDTGDQGTLGLNVTIGGKGFKKGAKAYFYLKGTTNPAGITVRATKFVSDASLIATIDIAAGATPDDFDIVVANADGRTGKGTELFAVLVKIDPCTLPDPEPTLSIFTSDAPGQPGWFDSTFGNGTAKVVGPRFISTSGNGSGTAVVDYADRVLVVGYRTFPCSTNQSGTELVAARFLADGSPDPGFGVNGVVTVAFGGGAGGGANVGVQADHKIVVAGWAKPDKRSASLPMIIRLEENGSLDTTFGSGGIFWMSLFGTKAKGSFVSVALQAAGTAQKIVAAGWSDAGPRFVLRLNPNGTLDATFNDSGYALLSGAQVKAVSVQTIGAEQRILVAGYGLDALDHYLPTVWRYTDSGSLDSTFGGGTGMVQTSFHVEDGRSLGDSLSLVTTDGANRILAVGTMSYCLVPGDLTTARSEVVLARYDANGNPDTSFGLDGTGRVWAPPGVIPKDVALAAAVQSDGRIVLAGYTGAADHPEGAVWRLNPDGSADQDFRGGLVIDKIVSDPRLVYFTGLALQADGRIIVSGHIAMPLTPSISYIVLARFWQ